MDPSAPSPEPMRPRIGRPTLVFGVLVAIGLAIGFATRPGDSGIPAAAAGPMVGAPAPEAEVDLFDGNVWRLSRHLASDGRPVVLNLWASWCGPCRAEIPELSAFAEAHPEFAVVGAAVEDTYADAMALADELRPTYPIGIDPTGRLHDRYSSFGLPVTFVIGSDGVVTHQFQGAVTASDLASLVG